MPATLLSAPYCKFIVKNAANSTASPCRDLETLIAKLNFKSHLFYNYFYCVVIQTEVKTTYFKELRKVLCVFSNRNSPSRGKKTKNKKSTSQIIKLFNNMREKRFKKNQNKKKQGNRKRKCVRSVSEPCSRMFKLFAIVFPRCRCFDKIVRNYQAETAKVQ